MGWTEQMEQSEFHGGNLRSMRGISLSAVQDKGSLPVEDERLPMAFVWRAAKRKCS
jgi:hypothetical protein